MTVPRCAPVPHEFFLALVVRRLASEATSITDFFGPTVLSDTERWHKAFAELSRCLPRERLQLAPDEAEVLLSHGVDWTTYGSTMTEVARIGLIVLAAHNLPRPSLENLLATSYRRGDNGERRAVLRALPFLPSSERFLGLAIDACRTNVRPIFEGIACENPYPAVHFPELNFNQMVLKAVFLGVELERIFSLAARVNPELKRMATDYASERRAAGRSVPADIDRILALEVVS